MKYRYWGCDWFDGLLIKIMVVTLSGSEPCRDIETSMIYATCTP